jgi:hypothetical protein
MMMMMMETTTEDDDVEMTGRRLRMEYVLRMHKIFVGWGRHQIISYNITTPMRRYPGVSEELWA